MFNVVDPTRPDPSAIRLGPWLRQAGHDVRDVSHLRWRSLLERHAKQAGTPVGRRSDSFGITLPKSRARRLLADVQLVAVTTDRVPSVACDRFAALFGSSGETFPAVDGELVARFASCLGAPSGVAC